MRAREKARLQKALDTIRNPGNGMKLVSHGFGPSTRSKVDPMVQMKALVDMRYRVSIEAVSAGYEVTLSEPSGHHAHHAGASISEAMNRAWKSVEADREGHGDK